jgi:CRISPR-associated protein Cmr6
MPIAAVPSYLGKDFRVASPALRFSLYLAIWTDRADQELEVRTRAKAKSPEGREVAALLQSQGMDATIRTLCERPSRPLRRLWEKNEFAARKAWNGIVVLNQSDRRRMAALLDREFHAFCTLEPDSAKLRLCARAIAPFTTGLGNEHPLENGFAFLNPYGLPYLPGSGVKGVLRQAAKELASGQWGDPKGWSTAKSYTLMQGKGHNRRPVLNEKGQPVTLSLLDVLFGRETEPGDTVHVRGALSFWDVIPQIAGDHLLVEIMTPHQSHYYQQNPAAGSTDPHDAGQPNPISFLTVPPGSEFTFYVVCDVAHLRRLTEEGQSGAPDLLAEGETHWKTLLEAAFHHAFTWLGFGAKTAVGYGTMKKSPCDGERAAAKPTGTSEGMDQAPVAVPRGRQAPPVPRSTAHEEVWPRVIITLNKGGGGIVTAQAERNKAEARGPAASAFLASLSEEQRRRLEKKGRLEGLAVVVQVEGNVRTLVRLASLNQGNGQ